MSSSRDHYEVLQVHPNAGPEVIRAAYRQLARMYHPDADNSAAANARMVEINLAYEVLGDPRKRAAYDGQRSARAGFGGSGASRGGAGAPSGGARAPSGGGTGAPRGSARASSGGAGTPSGGTGAPRGSARASGYSYTAQPPHESAFKRIIGGILWVIQRPPSGNARAGGYSGGGFGGAESAFKRIVGRMLWAVRRPRGGNARPGRYSGGGFGARITGRIMAWVTAPDAGKFKRSVGRMMWVIWAINQRPRVVVGIGFLIFSVGMYFAFTLHTDSTIAAVVGSIGMACGLFLLSEEERVAAWVVMGLSGLILAISWVYMITSVPLPMFAALGGGGIMAAGLAKLARRGR